MVTRTFDILIYTVQEAANSVARKRDMKIRDRLLRLTHAKPVDTTPKKTEVWKRSRVLILQLDLEMSLSSVFDASLVKDGEQD